YWKRWKMEGLDLLKIGEAIKIRRIKRRIHQTKLAEQLGISQTHLSNAENGRVMLSLKALLKLKMIFDCTLDELVDPENYDELGKKKEKVKRYKLVRCSE
ncbi:MAG: helix-turn-helix transcriptional regulator, partial [Enterococcus sp.]|nr:helix-turn-helix transcriptional regulator [Enterococcus sp.]